MGNCMKGLIVTFTKDMNDEDIERMADAMRWFRYVLDVTPLERDFNDAMNLIRAKGDVRRKIMQVLDK